MKTLKIEIPNGFEIDKENSTFEQIVFKEFKKELPKTWEELPKTWEELKKVKGFFINHNSSIHTIHKIDTNYDNKNIFATRQQAQASIALAQLSQLREVYRNGWVPDWNDYESKYIIDFIGNEINTPTYEISNAFLSFQDEETRDLFLKNFKDLIEQAKPLMS